MSGAATASVMPPGAGGRVLDFRRRGTPLRRRRKSLLVKLLKPLVAAVALVAVPAALVAWVLTAPLFRLSKVEVKTAKGPVRVSPDWIRGALLCLRPLGQKKTDCKPEGKINDRPNEKERHIKVRCLFLEHRVGRHGVRPRPNK